MLRIHTGPIKSGWTWGSVFVKSLPLESKLQPRLRSAELVCLITGRPHPTLPGTVVLDKEMPQPCEVKTALLSGREFEMVKRKHPEAKPVFFLVGCPCFPFSVLQAFTLAVPVLDPSL